MPQCVIAKMIMLAEAIPNELVVSVCFGAAATIVIMAMSYRKNPMQRKGKDAELCADDFFVESPLIKSEWLSSFIGNKSTVNLKLDVLQPSGSYKIRGISAFMKQKYSLNVKVDTFITTSSSNAGFAIAYTAKRLNCKCMVIVPEADEENKNVKMLEDLYGAEIQFYGESWSEANEYAVNLGNHQNGKYCYVPNFDESAYVHGYSLIIDELARQYGDNMDDDYPDCIIAAIETGEFLNGILGGLYHVNWSRDVRIVAAQSENAALFHQGVNNSYKPYAMKTKSCDGNNIGFNVITKQTMDLAEKYDSFNPIKSIIVKDLDVLNVCTLFGIKQNILIEPSAGIGIAALYKNKNYFNQFNNICIIVAGGNNVYFNKDLLGESESNGVFNDKPTSFSPKKSYASSSNIMHGDDEFTIYDSETEDI